MNPTRDLSSDVALARGTVYQCLAHAWLFPGEAGGEVVTQSRWLETLQDALERLPGSEAVQHALAVLESVRPSIDLTALQREYTQLFSNTALTDFPPYGGDYLASHIFMKAQSMADVTGFYRAFGLDIGEGTERPDHISAELEFLGYLCWKEAYATEHGLAEALDVTRAAQRLFFMAHLGRWAPLFLRRLEAASVQPFYGALAAFARAFLAAEEAGLGVSPEAISELPQEAPQPEAFVCGADEGSCPLRA